MTHPWEELARAEPYYAVLTDARYLSANLNDETREAFFASGEADVAHIIDRIGFTPRSALDFGCGVGRLTRALTRRCSRVVGVDVSETMLEHARANAPDATFTTFVPDEQFELVVSLIVLQHVPVKRGLDIIRTLAERTTRAIVLQFATRRPGGVIRRLGRRIKAALPKLARDQYGLPYMEMNTYDISIVRSEFGRANLVVSTIETTDYGGIESVTIVGRKV